MHNGQEKANINKGSSVYEQTEKILSDIVKDHRHADFLACLEKHQTEFAAAEPRTELTYKDIEALERVKEEVRLKDKRDWLRNLLRDIVTRSVANPQLRKRAMRGLELLDRFEAGERRLLGSLETTVFNVIELCRVECKEPAEKDKKATPTKGGRIGTFFWTLYEKTLKVIVDAFLDRVCPK